MVRYLSGQNCDTKQISRRVETVEQPCAFVMHFSGNWIKDMSGNLFRLCTAEVFGRGSRLLVIEV